MTPGEEIIALVKETLNQPRRAAERLAAMELPSQVPWIALALVAILWVIVDQILGTGQGAELPPWPGAELMSRPLTAVPLNAASSLMVALSVKLCGRMFGQAPRLGQALVIVLWLQFLLLLGYTASMLLALVLPPAGGLLGLAAIAIYLWFLVQFSMVLNRMDSMIGAALGLLLSAIIVSFSAGFVLMILIAMGLVTIPGAA